MICGREARVNDIEDAILEKAIFCKAANYTEDFNYSICNKMEKYDNLEYVYGTGKILVLKD